MPDQAKPVVNIVDERPHRIAITVNGDVHGGIAPPMRMIDPSSIALQEHVLQRHMEVLRARYPMRYT